MTDNIDRHYETTTWNVMENSNVVNRDFESGNDLILKFKERIEILIDDDLGALSEIRKKLKQNFSFLTDDDLYLSDGNETELVTKVVQKVGQKNLKKILSIL